MCIPVKGQVTPLCTRSAGAGCRVCSLARCRRQLAGRPGSRAAIQAVTWVRAVNPSLAKMLATCRAAVAGLIVSSSAMARLDRPRAIRPAICSSRLVSGDAAPGSPACPGRPGPPGPGWPPRRFPARRRGRPGPAGNGQSQGQVQGAVHAQPGALGGQPVDRGRAQPLPGGGQQRAGLRLAPGPQGRRRRAQPDRGGQVAGGGRELGERLQAAGDGQPLAGGQAQLRLSARLSAARPRSARASATRPIPVRQRAISERAPSSRYRPSAVWKWVSAAA